MPRLTMLRGPLCRAAGCLLILLGCSHDTTQPDNRIFPKSTALVSAPDDHDLVYVSMRPGPSRGQTASVSTRAGASVTATMIDGGFDPVAISAGAGDTLWVQSSDERGNSIVAFAVVPISSMPVVVRTSPPNLASGVPVSDNVLAVFSEPVDSASLVGGMRLYDSGGQPVAAGLARAGCDPGWCWELVPSGWLAGNATYALAISNAVRSRAGTALADTLTVTFQTGARPAVTVDSFSVIEYHRTGDTTWSYAPQLKISNGGPTIEITSFSMTLPGIGTLMTDACNPVQVASGATASVFLEVDGNYDLSLDTGNLRASGTEVAASITFTMSSAEYVMPLRGPIVPGFPPTTVTAGYYNWYQYC